MAAAFKVLALVLLASTACLASSSRIVGGSDASIEDFPSVVQVESLSVYSGVWSQTCGATILTSLHVLSAAHCFDGTNFLPEYRRVRAGTSYRETDGVVSYVNQVLRHPDYSPRDLNANICVARLNAALTFSSVVAQASIVTQGFVIPDNVAVVLTGWGATSEGGSNSEVLQQTSVLIVNNEKCAQIYQSAPWPQTVTEEMICAGLVDVGGQDACNGDEGGPMFLDNVVVGISSWGRGCGQAGYPGVSTRVASYTNWILSAVTQI